MKIEDDFLDQEKFEKISQAFDFFDDVQNEKIKENRKRTTREIHRPLPWYYSDSIDSYDEDVDKFQFCHTFFEVGTQYPPTIEIIDPIIKKIKPVALLRIKANLLTRTPNIVENTFHVDMKMSEEKLKQWATSIFYVNTNNGYTKFEDGTKVESIANRMITFPANIKHAGTSCSDQKTRVVINFNYFKQK